MLAVLPKLMNKPDFNVLELSLGVFNGKCSVGHGRGDDIILLGKT